MDKPVLHWTVFNSDKNKLLFAYAYDQHFVIRRKKYIVPGGYWFDGASVPRFLWSVFSPTGKAMVMASLHDLLYDTKGIGLNGEYNLSRYEVDKLFLHHMLDYEVPKTQAYMMYNAVRMFGQKWWDRKTEIVIYKPNMQLDAELSISV